MSTALFFTSFVIFSFFLCVSSNININVCVLAVDFCDGNGTQSSVDLVNGLRAWEHKFLLNKKDAQDNESTPHFRLIVEDMCKKELWEEFETNSFGLKLSLIWPGTNERAETLIQESILRLFEKKCHAIVLDEPATLVGLEYLRQTDILAVITIPGNIICSKPFRMSKLPSSTRQMIQKLGRFVSQSHLGCTNFQGKVSCALCPVLLDPIVPSIFALSSFNKQAENSHVSFPSRFPRIALLYAHQDEAAENSSASIIFSQLLVEEAISRAEKLERVDITRIKYSLASVSPTSKLPSALELKSWAKADAWTHIASEIGSSASVEWLEIVNSLKENNFDAVIMLNRGVEVTGLLKVMEMKKYTPPLFSLLHGPGEPGWDDAFGNTIYAQYVTKSELWTDKMLFNQTSVAQYAREFKLPYRNLPSQSAVVGMLSGQLLESAAQNFLRFTLSNDYSLFLALLEDRSQEHSKSGSEPGNGQNIREHGRGHEYASQNLSAYTAIWHQALYSQSFDTIWGTLSLDENGLNSRSTPRLLQWINSRQEIVLPRSLATQSMYLPAPSWFCRKHNCSDPVQIVLSPTVVSYVFLSIVLAATVVFLTWLAFFTFENRYKSYVKYSSPRLNLAILFGAFLWMSSSVAQVLAMSLNKTFPCELWYYSLVCGFDLLFGTILLKLYRVYCLTHNKTLNSKRLTDGLLLRWLIVLCILDSILPLLLYDFKWNMEPKTPLRDPIPLDQLSPRHEFLNEPDAPEMFAVPSYLVCTRSNKGLYRTISVLIFKLPIVAATLYFAFATKNTHKLPSHEARNFVYALYHVSLLILVVASFRFIAYDSPDGYIVIVVMRNAVIVFPFTLCVFWKQLMIHARHLEEEEPIRERASLTNKRPIVRAHSVPFEQKRTNRIHPNMDSPTKNEFKRRPSREKRSDEKSDGNGCEKKEPSQIVHRSISAESAIAHAHAIPRKNEKYDQNFSLEERRERNIEFISNSNQPKSHNSMPFISGKMDDPFFSLKHVTKQSQSSFSSSKLAPHESGKHIYRKRTPKRCEANSLEQTNMGKERECDNSAGTKSLICIAESGELESRSNFIEQKRYILPKKNKYSVTSYQQEVMQALYSRPIQRDCPNENKRQTKLPKKQKSSFDQNEAKSKDISNGNSLSGCSNSGQISFGIDSPGREEIVREAALFLAQSQKKVEESQEVVKGENQRINDKEPCLPPIKNAHLSHGRALYNHIQSVSISK